MDPLLVWGIALLAAALVLFALELFIPSGGLLGVVAGVAAVAGVIAFWKYNEWWGVSSTVLVLVTAPIAFNFAVKVIPHTPFGKRLILAEDDDELARRALEAQRETEAVAAVIGATGIARTDLRPIGTAEIDGVRVEVLAEGGIIPEGSPVRVTGVVDNQIKVRLVK